jgi:preprotein translocase subunit SecB
MPTPLQLNSYCIDQLRVEANPKYDGRQVRTGTIAVDPQHLLSAKDSEKHQLVLSVTFGCVKNDPKGAPYTGKIVGRAFFRLVPSDLSEQDRASLVLLNGSAILFGLLRAQVAQVTALGPNGTFLLPPVNLVEAFRARLETAERAEPARTVEAAKPAASAKKKSRRRPDKS